MSAATRRRPDYDLTLRLRALATYRREGSYRKASKAMGISYKRVQVLVKEALKHEMEEARNVA